MSTLIRSSFMPGRYNNYLIGGNLCNAFALGEIGSMEEFFMIGSEPTDESNYPMITANILDSEGNVLFRLVKNVLVFNPGHCSKILGNHIGYEIHDSEGNMVFKISTKFEEIPQLQDFCYITTIEAKFFNKKGEMVFLATGGGQNERIEAKCKSAIGFSGGFGLVMDYSEEELEMVRISLSTMGELNERITGNHTGKKIHLDGKFVKNATLSDCEIIIEDGSFLLGENCTITSCSFNFMGKAGNIFNLVKQLEQQGKPK